MSRIASCLVAMVLAGAMGLTTRAGGEPSTYELRFGLPPGTYEVRQRDAVTVTLSVKGNEEVRTAKQTILWGLTVGTPDERSRKKARMKVKVVQIVSQLEGPAEYDSARPAEGQDEALAFVYGELPGVVAEVTLDADDSVLEVSGLDRHWARHAKRAVTAAQKSAIAVASESLSDTAIKQRLRRYEALLPKRPVPIEQPWRAGFGWKTPLVGELELRYTCRLKEIEDTGSARVARIELDGAYESAGPMGTTRAGAALTVRNLDVIDQAALQLDLATGLVTCDDGYRRLTADVTEVNPDGTKSELHVATSISSRVTISPVADPVGSTSTAPPATPASIAAPAPPLATPLGAPVPLRAPPGRGAGEPPVSPPSALPFDPLAP